LDDEFSVEKAGGCPEVESEEGFVDDLSKG
jgi:hypothetical protein